MFRKITEGYVVQRFNDDGTLDHQEFIASTHTEYETREGYPIHIPDERTNAYHPFDMIQPKEN
jgi:hypothetical protein